MCGRQKSKKLTSQITLWKRKHVIRWNPCWLLDPPEMVGNLSYKPPTIRKTSNIGVFERQDFVSFKGRQDLASEDINQFTVQPSPRPPPPGASLYPHHLDLNPVCPARRGRVGRAGRAARGSEDQQSAGARPHVEILRLNTISFIG
ncbi:Piwi-like protein 1 [Frankliniella fusca]|uniref:Piwi-like protein 1 n=1 Tax=Frankliniella fusca TaxID=407009 RepID=A0AAE1H2D5_9NEOP|nr:Piwi-like protein 1 [Frankliniella fusca]